MEILSGDGAICSKNGSGYPIRPFLSYIAMPLHKVSGYLHYLNPRMCRFCEPTIIRLRVGKAIPGVEFPPIGFLYILAKPYQKF